jgi:hypothetical protein
MSDHKRLCILIISCEFYNKEFHLPDSVNKPCINRERWLYEKQCWKKYMHLNENIDVYFLEYGEESRIEEDTIFVPYDGFGRGIYKKTIYGLKLLNKSYDFYFRTNLNTFVIFDKILDKLNNIEKDYNMNYPFYGGHVYPAKYLKCKEFVSGTGILMNLAAKDELLNHGFNEEYTTSKYSDDNIIRMVFYDLNILPIKCHFLLKCNKKTDINLKLFKNNNYCYVRTNRDSSKNSNINEHLLQKFYNIEF